MLKAIVTFQLDACTLIPCSLLTIKLCPDRYLGSSLTKTILCNSGALVEKQASSNGMRTLLQVASDWLLSAF